MDETLEAEVPLEPTGTPNGVKNFGGLLEHALRSMTVECLPRDLPDRITVDVTNLNIGDSIHVRDIQLPSGVTAKEQPELTVFSVVAPAVEEEPVAAAAEGGYRRRILFGARREAASALRTRRRQRRRARRDDG